MLNKIVQGLLGGLLGVIGIAAILLPFLVVFFWALMFIGWCTGLYLAFSASFILGVIVLVVQPSPLIIGLFYLGFGVDLAAKIMQNLS